MYLLPRARRFVENIEWMKAAAVNSYIGLKVIKLFFEDEL